MKRKSKNRAKRAGATPAKAKTKTTTYLVYGLGAGALLSGAYLGYQYLRNRRDQQGDMLPVPEVNSGSFTPVPPPPVNKAAFPLKKGSKGSLVVSLQKALLAMGGQAAAYIQNTSVKPNGEPDGVFGEGTVKALKAAGYPTVITDTTFSQLLAKAGATGSSFAAKMIADGLIKAANRQSLYEVLAGLKQISSASEYSQVSSYFKHVRIQGTRVTSLVNALLSVAFKANEEAKAKIRAEFSRMGLKQDASGRWSIPSGLGRVSRNPLLPMAVTKKPTLLKNGNGSYVLPQLPANTAVGYITAKKQGISQILTTSGEVVYAPLQNLKLL